MLKLPSGLYLGTYLTSNRGTGHNECLQNGLQKTSHEAFKKRRRWTRNSREKSHWTHQTSSCNWQGAWEKQTKCLKILLNNTAYYISLKPFKCLTVFETPINHVLRNWQQSAVKRLRTQPMRRRQSTKKVDNNGSCDGKKNGLAKPIEALLST